MKRILFLCVANSARSQMAEGLARQILTDVTVESAGSAPSGQVHPEAIAAMKRIGISIQSHRSQAVEELPKEFLDQLDYVITLCAEEVCPVMITTAEKLHWPLTDPAAANPNEIQESFNHIRDQIHFRLKEWAKTF